MTCLGNGARVPVGIETRGGRLYRMEVEMVDDPRTDGGRILSIYDVSEIYDLRSPLGGAGPFENMIGKSSAIRRVFQQIQDMANIDSTTLIEGETGTGKELVANALHSVSHRNDRPFMAVNCAGLTDSLLTSQLFGHKRGAFTGAVGDQKGLFEAAEGGTLFLDEIGDISMPVQMGLWFLDQSRAATGKPVEDISEDAMRVLMDYAWPGNVRELRSAIEFAVIRCKNNMLKIDDLPPEIRIAQLASPAAGATEGVAHDDEDQRILAALRQSGGNRAVAARLLGIGRTTLYRCLEGLRTGRS